MIIFILNLRKPAVVIKHSGLDESGDSNASNDFDLPITTNGHFDVTRLPKGRILLISSMLVNILALPYLKANLTLSFDNFGLFNAVCVSLVNFSL